MNPNIVELDFDCFRSSGAWRGGPVAFYIMTPESNLGGATGDCPDLSSTVNRVYSTDNSINDDGDYVHFLIYTSRSFTNGYYFGWEDLFRGGDNDFEDVLVRAIGLVPTCNPTPEVCDGRDNNCNGEIDDGLGTTTCGQGACRRTVNNCNAGVPQTCTPGTATPEVCDNVDNNCNGSVDEGLSRACSASCGAGTQYCTAGVWGDCVSTTTPTPEVCDNRDNDCNGMVDDGLRRPCSTVCGSGTETCAAGTWGACTAPTPGTEVCDGMDNDCDGLVDENIPPQACAPADLRCGPGMAVCVGGRFVCTAPTPRPEICDGMDNDCDGTVDNGVPDGGTCGSNIGVCRAGTNVCRGGRYVCEGATEGTPEVCNNLDDDCDGFVDEDNPGGGAACNTDAMGNPICGNGTLRCREGTLRCEGAVGRREICNCIDDDCDGMVDEDAPGENALCPGGGRCVSCQCRTPCLPGEFPCSVGLVCNADNLCVPPMCGSEVCRNDQICVNNRCVEQCETVTCPSGEVCTVRDGRAICVEDSCYGTGCQGTQICRQGACVNNGCASTTCPSGTFCRPRADGSAECVGSCATVRCPEGQSCTAGACVANPCQGVRCSAGLTCQVVAGRGTCVADPCANVGARPGRVCVDGQLVDDPCSGVTCPAGANVVCRNGQCVDPTLQPLTRERVIGGGGGCSASPGGASSGGLWAALGVLALAAGTARRRRAGARRGGDR
ncbi:MAG: DUF4114 domain-containing protein [Polyangiales bacterium]